MEGEDVRPTGGSGGATRRVTRSGGFWAAAEDAVLGTDTDAAVARRLGRSFRAVNDRRRLLGIPPFVVKVDGGLLKRLRSAAGLTQAGLAALSGLHERAVTNLETGWKDGVRRDKAARMAAALGCGLAELEPKRGRAGARVPDRSKRE